MDHKLFELFGGNLKEFGENLSIQDEVVVGFDWESRTSQILPLHMIFFEEFSANSSKT